MSLFCKRGQGKGPLKKKKWEGGEISYVGASGGKGVLSAEMRLCNKRGGLLVRGLLVGEKGRTWARKKAPCPQHSTLE